MSTKSGGCAFPVSGMELPNGEFLWPETGMTLRQWYAGMALMGQLAFSPQDSFDKAHRPTDVAKVAWSMADAMLAAQGDA